MKTALVTGASRGIGLAIARELGVNGYQVAVMATRGESFYPETLKQQISPTVHRYSEMHQPIPLL